MEEKSKLENPEKQAKPEVKDEALNEINGGGSGIGSGKKVTPDAQILQQSLEFQV